MNLFIITLIIIIYIINFAHRCFEGRKSRFKEFVDKYIEQVAASMKYDVSLMLHDVRFVTCMIPCSVLEICILYTYWYIGNNRRG